MTDKTFSDSIRKAIQDFGEDIILDRRLIGILKDYQAFSSLPPAELITRILIEDGAIRRITSLKNANRKNAEDIVSRIIANLELQYGFSEKYISPTIFSLLQGLGISMDRDKESTKIHSEAMESSEERHGIEVSRKESDAFNTNIDILDIRKTPVGRTYLDLREELCRMTNGIKLTDYKTKDGNKNALFTCDIHPYRNVEVKISTGNTLDLPTLIQVTLINKLNKDCDTIRDEARRITSILDRLYASVKEWEPLDDTDLTNDTLYEDFKMAKKYKEEHLLQHYFLDEGHVSCKLHIYHNGWSIAVYLNLRELKSTNSSPWTLPPSPTPINITQTPSSESNKRSAEDKEEYSISKRYSFSEIRKTLKKIISIKYGIPRRDLENDNTLEELEEISTDIIDIDELIEEIEDKFEVFLDADLIDEYMTIDELTKEIMDMMDD